MQIFEFLGQKPKNTFHASCIDNVVGRGKNVSIICIL